VRLNLIHDNVPVVYTSLYLLLATGYSGVGTLSGHLVVFVTVQNFWDCGGRSFCIFKSIAYAACKSDPEVVKNTKIDS
jgi:hypothetical protein